MKNFISALQFITILPVGPARPFEASALAPHFPLVGLALGLLLAGCDALALRLWHPPVAALLDVILLIAVTGAFHIDGLGDTADGLYGCRPPAKALAIMKDSRVGSMGVVAIVSVLALKWAGISGLTADRGLLLVLVPAYARAGMLFGMRWLPYGRPEGGTGQAFFTRPLRPAAFSALLPLLALSLLAGPRALVLNVGFAALTTAILLYYRHKINCITGDMLGAMTETTEAGLFLLLSAGGPW